VTSNQRDGSDRLVSAALASAELPKKLAYGARAVMNGFWLGALSDEQLRALDERYYAREAIYRTSEWNEQGLFDWEEKLVRAHFPQDGTLVVLGSGGGREVLALRRDGYDAVGYEAHPELAAFADEFMTAHGHPSQSHHVARDAFPDDVGACSGVIVGWAAYSLIHGRDRRIALLRSARAHLPRGGSVLVSFFEKRRGDREARFTRTLANGLRRLRGAAPIELGDTLRPNLIHVFNPAELADEASAAGFDIVAHEVIQELEASMHYAAAVLAAGA